MRRLKLWWPRSPESAEGGARTSIANRLRWSYLISSTLPLLLVGALLLKINTDAQQGRIYSDQKGLASRVARDISRYVANLQNQFDLRMSPSAAIDQSVEQLTDVASNLEVRNAPNLIDLSVLDGAGKERLRVYKLLKTPQNQLRDLSGDPNVQRALREDKSSYNAIALNKDGVHSFFMTRPLHNAAGIVVGALRAEISAEPLVVELDLSTVSPNSYAYLISQQNSAVLLDDGAPGFTAPRQLNVLLTSPSGTATYTGARDQDVIGAALPVMIGGDGSALDWAVVVEQPANLAFASVRRSVLLLTLLVIVAGMLALVWAFRQARRFLQPLAALREGAAALGGGHLEYRIEALGDDELGDLAQTFNHMAEHLQASLAEIEMRNERFRRGLALARDIQIGLLPDRPPWNGDMIEVHARSIPAYEVGGDFYTYLALPEGRAAIAIGDISGKGVGAALLMALTSSAVESQGRELEHPARVLSALNQLLAPRLKASHMNAALLFAVIDPQKRMLHVANAGMIAPVRLTLDGSYFIDAGGLPLGAFEGAIYQEHSVRLNPGDGLLFLSDGVVEAHNAAGELWGFDRLEATIAEASPPGDVRALVDLVIERVQEFMGDTEQHDDITMVAVRPAIVLDDDALDEEPVISYATV
jgi:serine phosphatase RsbU (regulator of sigma subunit)